MVLYISSINSISIITYVHPISLNRTMASVGILRCLAMSGELLTTLEAVDGFDAQVGPDPFSVIQVGLVGRVGGLGSKSVQKNQIYRGS